MINLLGTAIHSEINKSRKNIFTFPTHERNQGLFRNVPANFWLFRTQGVKDWDFRYGELPSNHFLLKENSLPPWVDFDILLSQNKAGQFQICKQLQTMTYLPIISIEHTLPPPGTPKEKLQEFKRNYMADKNVFITEYNRDAWLFTPEESIVAPHAIDTKLFSPGEGERKNTILTVANDYINRDTFLNFRQYQKVTKGLPVTPVGDTPGLSQAAKDVKALVSFYQNSRIFLNTAHVSPVPMSLLEAMSAGCAVVSCKTCAIPEYIYHGYNGLLAESDEEMKSHLERLLKDKQLSERLGKNARATIVDKCSLPKFTQRWEEILEI